MDRKDYWNKKYMEYWKARSNEADNDFQNKGDSKLIKGDSKTPSNILAYQLFDKLNYSENEMFLDYGCGFGRFVDYFLQKQVSYHAIDISQAMIDELIGTYPGLADKVKVAEGESLPFADNMFSKIVCYGVFDACYQEQALAEMLRVCGNEGCIVLTGKNSYYYPDDEKALVAERNARRKGHPNFFTDARAMRSALLGQGIDVIYESYVSRRGDSPIAGDIDSMDCFYEWHYILKKTDATSDFKFDKFSDEYSETWRDVHKE